MWIGSILLLLCGVDAGKDNKYSSLAKGYLHRDKGSTKELFDSPNGFQNRGDLFTRMAKSRDSKKLLIDTLARITKGKRKGHVNFAKVGKYLEQLSVEEILKIGQIEDGCYFLGDLLKGLNNSVLKELGDQRCIESMVDGAVNEFSRKDLIRLLPEEWINRTKYVTKIMTKSIQYATPEQIYSISQNHPRMAGYVNPKVLSKMKPDQLRMLSPRFFSLIPHIGRVDLKEVLPHMDENILGDYKGELGESSLKALSPEQFSNYINADKKDKCMKVPLHAASEDQLKGIDGDCLLNYISRKDHKSLGKKWEFLDINWDLEDDEGAQFFKFLNREDKKHIPIKMWNTLLQSKSICKSVSGVEGVHDKNNHIVVSPECFIHLKDPSMLGNILTNPDLNEEIFSLATFKKMKNLRAKVNDKTYNGFDFLKLIKSEKRGPIIKNISKLVEDSDDHGCAAITNAKQFHQISHDFNDETLPCLSAIPITWSKDDYLKSPILISLMNKNSAVELFKEDLGRLNSKIMSELLKKGFLNDLTTEEFEKLDTDALGAITSEYLPRINFLDKLSTETLGNFNEKVYERLDSRLFEKIGWGKISDRQLPHVSTLISTPSDRVTAKLTPEMVKSLGKRFSLFTEAQLEAIPLTAWSAVTESQFMDLSPEALSSVEYNQMSALPESVRAKISKEQARLIGIKKFGTNSPIPLFQSMKAQLRAEAQKSIEEREHEAQISSNAPSTILGSRTLMVGLCSATALLLL